MTTENGSRKRFGFRAALAVAALFLAGLLAGVAITHWLSPAPAPTGLSEALGELDLTPEQAARIDRILTTSQSRTDRVLEEVLPRVQAVVDSVDGEIRQVLTDTQRIRLEEIRRRHVIVQRQVIQGDSRHRDDADTLGP